MPNFAFIWRLETLLSSMIQFLIEKGAVYHKCCSDKFSKRTRERNSSGFKLTPQNSSETIPLFSKSRTDSRVVDTINQDHGSYLLLTPSKETKIRFTSTASYTCTIL